MPRKFGSGERIDEWSRKIQDIMDEMRNRMFFEFRATGTWQPRINAYDSEDAYYLCVELAGLEQDELTVECLGDRRIRLRGRRHRPIGSLQGAYNVEVLEIDEGPFEREVELACAVDVNAVEVSYDRGCLWILLPKMRA